MKRGNNEKWKEFENRVSAKRNKTEKKGRAGQLVFPCAQAC